MIVYPVQERAELEKQPVVPVRQEAPLEGWELELAKKSPSQYAAFRTAAAIVPFASHLFPSHREDFKQMTLPEKAIETGLDLAIFVPARWIGTGLKIAYKGTIGYPAKGAAKVIAAGIKRTPFPMKIVEQQPKQFLDKLSESLRKFSYEPPVTRFALKHELTAKQAQAIMKGESVTWEPLGRSGSFIPEAIPKTERFFTKEGVLKKPIAQQIEKYSLSREVQELNHYKREWKRLITDVIKPAKSLGEDLELRFSNMFRAQATRLFGSEAGKTLTLGNITEGDLKKMLYDTLLNRGKLLRGTDASFKSWLLPSRKVFGPFEELYGTFSKIYSPLAKAVDRVRQGTYGDVISFQAQLAGKIVGGKALGTMALKKTGEHAWKPSFSKAVWEEAGKLARSIDDLARKGETTQLQQALMERASPHAQAIVKTYQEWTDQMYLKHSKEKIFQLFEKSGLTTEGQVGLEALTRGRQGLFHQLDDYFSAGANVDYQQKLFKTQEILKSLQEAVEQNPNWFVASSIPGVTKEFLAAHKGNLKKALIMRTGKQKEGFLNYIEGYATRVPEKFGASEFLPQTGGVTRSAAYTKRRLREESLEASSDLAKMIEARATMQNKELYLYPKLPQIYQAMETLPTKLRNFSEHFLSRIMGDPSPVDEKVAVWMSKLLGNTWDGKRVMETAWKVNDVIYLGGLGFKPFSAMRNYFQPLLLVPGDLGGIKDVYWLTKGYGKLFSPEHRAYIREIGAIREYTPDLLIKPRVVDFGKSFKVGGVELSLPSWEKFRDLGMWMFRNSDIHNRYVAGGAAVAKWEHFATRFNLSKANDLQLFKRSMNITGREKVVQTEINRNLALGTKESIEEAKRLFTRDVIADTQFLYSTVDSPLATHAGGAITRTAGVFQTWWMNYGSLLGKWMTRSETMEAGIERMFTGMLSAAIAYNLMEPMWGKRTALTTIGTGPFPLGLTVPPSWVPFYEGLKTVKAATEIPFDPEGGINKTKQQMVNTLKSTAIFIPGGLQAKQFVEGGMKSGSQGILDAIIKYHRE